MRLVERLGERKIISVAAVEHNNLGSQTERTSSFFYLNQDFYSVLKRGFQRISDLLVEHCQS